MSLANGLSILFIFSKNQLLALLIFAMVSLVGLNILIDETQINLQVSLKHETWYKVRKKFQQNTRKGAKERKIKLTLGVVKGFLFLRN